MVNFFEIDETLNKHYDSKDNHTPKDTQADEFIEDPTTDDTTDNGDGVDDNGDGDN